MTSKDDDLLIAALELKMFNEKAASTVIRELEIIEKSLSANPDKLHANVARLNSLCEHITLTFKKSAAEKLAAKLLNSIIQHKMNKLIKDII